MIVGTDQIQRKALPPRGHHSAEKTKVKEKRIYVEFTLV